jgi:6-phosphogluconolactonase
LNTPPPDVVVARPDALAELFARRTAALAERSIGLRGTFSLAIPGGSTAKVMLPVLAQAPIAWERVDLLWCDERAVPPDDEESNFSLAERIFVRSPAIGRIRMHRMPADDADLYAAAAAYERLLHEIAGSPPLIDLALVGVGEDGHVCSLFPGHAALLERARWVVPVEDSPKPPPRRLTFTLRALASARITCIATFGERKAAVVREALDDPAASTPVALALRAAREAWVLISG